MIVMLLAALASQAAVNGDSGVTNLRGRCQYSDAMAQFRQEASLASCDSLAIDRGEGTSSFDFSRRGWGSMVRFSGKMSGQRMAINRVLLRSGNSIEATGICEIFYRGEKIFVVSCLARAGSKTYGANFIPSPL